MGSGDRTQRSKCRTRLFWNWNFQVLKGPSSCSLFLLCLAGSPLFSLCSVLIHLLTPVPILSFTFLYTVCPHLSGSGCYICSENAWMDQNPLELLQITQVSGEDTHLVLPNSNKSVWLDPGLSRLFSKG